MTVDAYIHRLHLSIDHALAVSYRRNVYEGKTSFVARITLVKGTPFYGYSVGYKFFLKIYIFDPRHMTRLADLLRQGTIMKKVFQPYESHLQYLLQWMCDYNLYGCGYIDCAKVAFRHPIPAYDDLLDRTHVWHDRSIPPDHLSNQAHFPRQSHCSIEIDLHARDILNRSHVKARPLHHDFIERASPSFLDDKLVHSMAGLWRDETRRRKARMLDADSGSSPFPPEVLVSMSAGSRSSQRTGWIHEDEYRALMARIIADERSKGNGQDLSFDRFVHNPPLESTVKTTLDSVEDLYPENVTSMPLSQSPNKSSSDMTDRLEVEVDEGRIASFIEDQSPYDSDEDAARELAASQPKRDDRADEKHEAKGVVRFEFDDETRPGGDDYGQQFKDALDDPPHIPLTSPSDLSELGIRPIHEMQQCIIDDFEMPVEYASDIKKASRLGKRSASEASRDGEKKRKIIHDSFSRKQALDSDLKTSPESNKTKGPSNNNPALPFSVVKDPHDPETIRRASQPSGSSQPNHPWQKQSHVSPKASGPSDSAQNGFQAPLASPNRPSQSINLSQPMLPSQHATTDSVNSRKSSSFMTDTSAGATSISQELVTSIVSSFDVVNPSKLLCFADVPPTAQAASSTLQDFGLSPIIYQDAYYSNESDVPDRPREYAGREFRLRGDTVLYLPDFDPAVDATTPAAPLEKYKYDETLKKQRRACKLRSWEIGDLPPSRREVEEWMARHSHVIDGPDMDHDDMPQQAPARSLSQIDGPTQKRRHGFKYSQRQKSTSVQHEAQYMSLMSLEVHVNTRADFVPNPEHDEIACVFWCIQSEDEELECNGFNDGTHVGILALNGQNDLVRNISRHVHVRVEAECSELDLINRMVDIVRMYDPDVLTGYEVHDGSWGYLIERARCKYDYNLCDEFSRMKAQSHGRFGRDNDRWGFNHTSTIRVTGRHMINIWRAMRGELNLLQYTMENVTFHVLHRRIPHYHYRELTRWYQSPRPRELAKVIDYFLSRVQLDLEILEQNELVPRTSEQARLLGVDFFSVFSRGSQFKVESLMFRIAKPENFILVSPSRKQVGGQNALECLPLVMEPQSDFYNSPLLVLDFQSLYPSVMIAYNYCYSTFLGRVVHWRGRNKMGFTEYRRQERLLELLQEHINIAPNGIMYVKPEIRKSLLAKMLGEILETRVMVKSGMKVDKDDNTLQRLLNNRQLALKLIANVTYGYTSASFSGRMPCSEIADSIVQTARETLEKAIALIHSVKRWGAEVVYGDTDSLFVYLKGRSKDDAFDVGTEIAKAITDINPRPVKLKFEKVYFPCVLLAKKRYVGFKYESRDQKEPEFDAKGIETVRRDGTPAEQKMEEKALKIFFRTADLSQVKAYFQRQCARIMQGSVSIQDFCFAREVKLGTYRDKGPPPPGALISTRRMLQDPRAEPQYGERVPYVVVTGAPGARLIDRCVAPETLLQSEHIELDSEYYISKNLVPPLERIFNLVGANVRCWYDEMPKVQRVRASTAAISYPARANANSVATATATSNANPKRTLESYMKSSLCLLCRAKLDSDLPLCNDCLNHAESSSLALRARLSQAEKKLITVEDVCRSCAALPWADEVKCDSKDCPVFYTRTKMKAGLNATRVVVDPVLDVLEGAEDGALEW